MSTWSLHPGIALGIALGLNGLAGAQGDSIELIGQGSYHGMLPEGRDRPSDSSGSWVAPRISEDFEGPVPTNDWSSSIVFPRITGNAHGESMFPWPLALKADGTGVRIASSPTLQPGGNGYFASFDPAQDGIHVGVAGMVASETTLAATGDWSLTIEAADNVRSMKTTVARGIPLAWIEITGDVVEIVAGNDMQVIDQTQARIVFASGGSTYAAFAPSDTSWDIDGSILRCTLPGTGRITIAALPDARTSTIELFQRHAYTVLLDTRVSWSHDPEGAVVRATYSFETMPSETGETRTLTGLLPHQRPYSNLEPEDIGFDTARGRMELVAVNSFTLELPIVPILPGLPVTDAMDLPLIRSYLQEIRDEENSINAPDSYWAGKQLGRVANAAHIADQLGEIETRDDLLARLRTELENWLSAEETTSSNRIQAEAFDSAEGVSKGAGEDGGIAITGIGDGDRIGWDSVDLNGSIPSRVLIRIASGVDAGGSALVQLRVGGEAGVLLAEAAVANTGGWDSWTTIPLGVSQEAALLLDGSSELVFVCETGFPGDVLSLEWIEWDIPSDGGGSSKDFAYDPQWTTLLANPGSYGLASELNDHHFHYGYMIAAAATIARFDPDWAGEDRWGGMVELLIKDVANWDRSDERFPFLRNIDPYVGHSYASGHAAFGAGNNQESSSEALNFAQAVVLWGEAAGREDLRELGLFLHAVEALAVEQYWFDADQIVYPEFSEHPIAGIVWDAGIAYATWWTANPEEIHGINLLPITGGSLYLARKPDAMQRAWDHLIQRNGGDPVEWRDIIWSWRALFDPTSALQWLETDDAWWPEAGSSRAHVSFWIQALAELGTLRSDISADSASAACFENLGTRTYVAFNAGAAEREIRFSDGFTICVGPGEMARAQEQGSCGSSADLDGNGTVDGADLTLLLGAWGICPGSGACIADLDGNGAVDGADLTLLLGAWGTP